MTSFRALVISMVMVVSSALQTQTQSHTASTNWDKLVSAFNSDVTLSMYTCNSDKYAEFVKALPPVDFSRMWIPPNKKILFYGTSLLHQALQNILVANADNLIKDGPLGGYEGNVLDAVNDPQWLSRTHQESKSQVDEQQSLHGYLVKWEFIVNSSITEIQNYAPLQKPESDEVLANLQWYMKEHRFDIAFFMNPHRTAERHAAMHNVHKKCISDCNARKEKALNAGAKPQEQCDISTCPDPPPEYRGRKDAKKLWDVMQAEMPGKIYQVEEWEFNDATRDEFFHADREHAIKSFDIFANRFCGVTDNCEQHTKNVGQHQCQPGTVIQVSERLVAKMG